MLPYQVCTDWWDGIRVCNIQFEWADVYYCQTGSGWDGPIIIPPGGVDGPADYPPPDCEITGVSDENPDQPRVHVRANEAVVDMTLVYDGAANQTVSRTDSIAMQPLNYFALGSTAVAVQCRNAVNMYSLPVMNVQREQVLFGGSDVVYGAWVIVGEDPADRQGEWHRNVTAEVHETSYTVGAIGARNGRYRHISVRDSLYAIGDTPQPAWEATYLINAWAGGSAQYWGGSCADQMLPVSICIDVNEFAHSSAPHGKAIITDLNIAFESSAVHLFTGKEITVAPQH